MTQAQAQAQAQAQTQTQTQTQTQAAASAAGATGATGAAGAAPTAAGVVSAAAGVHPHPSHDASCIFCRIVAGELPARKVYEDEQAVAFHDINPSAPVHFLVIPKQHIVNLYDGSAHPALLGHLMSLCGPLARQQGLERGFRVQINNGPGGGQEVYHLHIHVLGGRK